MPPVSRTRRAAGRLAQTATTAGRRAGVLAYQPEQRTTEEWTEAYRAGSLDYYGRFDELARYSVLVGYIDWFRETAGRPLRILDAGCGTGLLRRRLADGAFSDYVGVDLSAAAIAVARSQDHERSRFEAGDVSAMELGRFDVVVLNEVLYYAPDPRAFLAGLRAMREPEGLLLVSMWRHPGDRTLWRLVDELHPIIDRVEVRNRSNPVNRRGWLVAACGTDHRRLTTGS